MDITGDNFSLRLWNQLMDITASLPPIHTNYTCDADDFCYIILYVCNMFYYFSFFQRRFGLAWPGVTRFVPLRGNVPQKNSTHPCWLKEGNEEFMCDNAIRIIHIMIGVSMDRTCNVNARISSLFESNWKGVGLAGFNQIGQRGSFGWVFVWRPR